MLKVETESKAENPKRDSALPYKINKCLNVEYIYNVNYELIKSCIVNTEASWWIS